MRQTSCTCVGMIRVASPVFGVERQTCPRSGRWGLKCEDQSSRLDDQTAAVVRGGGWVTPKGYERQDCWPGRRVVTVTSAELRTLPSSFFCFFLRWSRVPKYRCLLCFTGFFNSHEPSRGNPHLCGKKEKTIPYGGRKICPVGFNL